MIETLIKILGTILFFIPGILLDWILFKKSSWLQRIVFSIALSGSIATIIGMALAFIGDLKLFPIFLSFSSLSLILFLVIIYRNEKAQTLYNKTFLHILAISLIGTAWRLFLDFKLKISGDAYAYASYLIGKSIEKTGSLLINVPDLHFYSGMVGGHTNYVGGTVSEIILKLLTLNIGYLNLFLGVLMYIGFSFLVVYALTKKTSLAYLASIILALGPIEIWRTTQGFIGHPLSYIALFSLFLLFIYGTISYFFLALIICSALILSYYTGAMTVIIISLGFCISNVFLFSLNKNNIIKQAILSVFTKRVAYFISLATISWFFVFGISNAGEYTKQNIIATTSIISSSSTVPNQSIENLTQPLPTEISTMPMPKVHYTGPLKIFGIPIIAIEDLIFLLLGLTFVINFIFGKREKQDLIMAVCCIPVAMLSLAFLIVNSPERVFYYFTFFAIAGIRLPKKYLKYIAILLILITIIFTGLRAYERPYLTKFDTELEAASFIKENLNETVFTDQHFANILIMNDYYDVQGISDVDTRVIPIYRETNFTKSVEALNSLTAEYIAITKRMREIYLLCLNLPQESMYNAEMYEKNYLKIYDNGDVRIYQVPLIKKNENSSLS